jgi:hypothetical protein
MFFESSLSNIKAWKANNEDVWIYYAFPRAYFSLFLTDQTYQQTYQFSNGSWQQTTSKE